LENANKENLINSEFSNKMNKLNMLRNLSKINKEKNDVYVSKDDIYKRGIGNVLKLSNFMKKRATSSSRDRKTSPNNIIKESIKSYVTNFPKVNSSNDYNDFNMDDLVLDHNLTKKNFKKEDKNLLENLSTIKKNDNSMCDIHIVPEANINDEMERTNVDYTLPEFRNNKNIQTNKTEIELLFKNSFNSILLFEKRINDKLDIIDNKIKKNFVTITELIKKSIDKNKLYYRNKEKSHKEIISKLQKELEMAKIIKESEPPIIRTWKNTLKDMENGNYNKAFSQILSTGITLLKKVMIFIFYVYYV